MCGIAGVFGYDEPLLKDILTRIRHRGPDGKGSFYSNGIGLAHARLSIIDPTEAAAQPMLCCNDRYVVSFNGEIYNYRELAKELKLKGYKFNEASDTAILAPLYDHYGHKMLNHLNGMFAFIIWDTVKKEAFIARDNFGVKPLYYTYNNQQLAVCSELKGLVNVPGLDKTIDQKALFDYLVHNWSAGEAVLYKGVRKLLPGHYMVFKSGTVNIQRWYTAPLHERVDRGLSHKQWQDSLLKKFDEAVERQCVSDVPIGAFLSGGVDSSAIVASMIKNGNPPKMTYCIGYEDLDHTKKEGFGEDFFFAQQVADHLKIPHKKITTSLPTADDLQALAITLDEPQADPAPLFVKEICRQAKSDGIKVLLSGAGGDDIFTGYRRHQVALTKEKLKGFEGIAKLLEKPFEGHNSTFSRKAHKFLSLAKESDEDFLSKAFHFTPPELAMSVLHKDIRDTLSKAPNPRLREAKRLSQGKTLTDRVLYMEMFGFLPDHNLNYTDKASMIEGVETRVPFLDVDLVDFAATIPMKYNISMKDAKLLLKNSLTNRLPRKVLFRSKTGFGAPVRHWITGPLSDMVQDIFTSTSFKNRNIFDVDVALRLFTLTKNQKIDAAYLILSICLCEMWFRHFDEARHA